jgi:hypothetical protein
VNGTILILGLAVGILLGRYALFRMCCSWKSRRVTDASLFDLS